MEVALKRRQLLNKFTCPAFFRTINGIRECLKSSL
jgi:hypothetical protein